MPTYVALLRGINLGARNRVAMADLRGLLDGLGYDDVRTHLQSGNAVLRTATRSASTVAKDIEHAITSGLGLEVPVVVRTAGQLETVVGADPFAGVADDPSRYFVHFADGPHPAAALDDLDLPAFEPERVVLRGSEAYLWLPGGLHKSRLAPVVERRLAGRTVTVRNWRTVCALAVMAAQPS